MSDNNNKKNISIEFFEEANKSKNEETIILRKLQNIDLTTYNNIFANFQYSDILIQDFDSFLQLLDNIKKEYKPELLNYYNIQSIINEGKLSFDKFNITRLISFYDKKIKNLEVSVNNKYIRTNNYANFYLSKAFFKGNHCFEIKILNMNNPLIKFGLIDINIIDSFKKEYLNPQQKEEKYEIPFEYMNKYECCKLQNPILIHKNNNIYNHFISYGDVFGFCFSFDKKLLYLFLNGKIVNSYSLNISIGKNNFFCPFISMGNNTEIIFNPGEKLEYLNNYKAFGFIPLDENKKNNYELSGLKNVTEKYFKILFYNGKSIINNKQITYSDINQIYHTIFYFLGNISFQHSYIINYFINQMITFINSDDNINDSLELCYFILRYILNSVKDKNLLLKNIILNLTELIHISLLTGQSSVEHLIKLLEFILNQKDFIPSLSKLGSTLKRVFTEIFITFTPMEKLLRNINIDYVIKSEENEINTNEDDEIENDIFKDLATSSQEFVDNLDNIENENNIKFSCFIDLLKIILNNGIKSNENENQIIFKSFKKYIKKQKKIIKQSDLSIHENKENIERKLNDIIKTFIIPLMSLFNNEFNNMIINDKKSIINFWIKKLKKDNNKEEEFIGGTFKYIKEQYAKDIDNFDEIINMKNNSLSNIILFEILDFFFDDKILENF